eukprot:766555-Hanusia_phi.AAC.14
MEALKDMDPSTQNMKLFQLLKFSNELAVRVASILLNKSIQVLAAKLSQPCAAMACLVLCRLHSRGDAKLPVVNAESCNHLW